MHAQSDGAIRSPAEQTKAQGNTRCKSPVALGKGQNVQPTRGSQGCLQASGSSVGATSRKQWPSYSIWLDPPCSTLARICMQAHLKKHARRSLMAAHLQGEAHSARQPAPQAGQQAGGERHRRQQGRDVCVGTAVGGEAHMSIPPCVFMPLQPHCRNGEFGRGLCGKGILSPCQDHAVS